MALECKVSATWGYVPWKTDQAIIKGGIVGCAAGRQLAKKGMQVTMYENDAGIGLQSSGQQGNAPSEAQDSLAFRDVKREIMGNPARRSRRRTGLQAHRQP